MKVMVDERVKHRLIGVVALIALATIFLPALMKKSDYHFDEKVNISVKLPEKPQLPKVAVPKQTAMFNSIQVARVDDRPVIKEPPKTLDNVKSLPVSAPELTLANPSLVVKPAIKEVALSKPMVVPPVLKQPQFKRDHYAVQLASFSKQKNAEQLVIQLKKKGYKAIYLKSDKQGDQLYKVIVGEGAHKNAAKDLQKQLAASVKLKGLIVKTGVS